MRKNYIYIINGKYYTDNYDKAIEKQKKFYMNGQIVI